MKNIEVFNDRFSRQFADSRVAGASYIALEPGDNIIGASLYQIYRPIQHYISDISARDQPTSKLTNTLSFTNGSPRIVQKYRTSTKQQEILHVQEPYSRIRCTYDRIMRVYLMNVNDIQGQKFVIDSAIEAKRLKGLTTLNLDSVTIADITISVLTFGPLLNMTNEEGDIIDTKGLKEAIHCLAFWHALRNGDDTARHLVDELSETKLQDFAKSIGVKFAKDTAIMLAHKVSLRVRNVLRGARHEDLEAPFRVENLVDFMVRHTVRHHFVNVLDPAWLTYKLRYNKYLKSLEARAILCNSMASLVDSNSICFRRAFLGLSKISRQWIALCYHEGERRQDREILELCLQLGWQGKRGATIESDDVDSRLSYHLKNDKNGLAAKFSEELATAMEQLVQSPEDSGASSSMKHFLMVGSIQADRKRLRQHCERELGSHGKLVSDELKQLCKQLASARRGGSVGE
jgi:hypothetical protein